MSAPFLNEASVQELTNLFEKTPLPVIMQAFEQVDDVDTAVFLLLLDVAAGKVPSGSSDEIRKTLAQTEDGKSKEQKEGTLTAYAQQIFAQFPMQRQIRIAEHLAETEMVDTGQAEEIWNDLVGNINSILQSTLFFGNGPKNLAKFLAKVDIKRQNQLMKALEKNQPELANTVADGLFTFEDLIDVPDEAIITLLQVLETNTLALALHEASPEIQDRFFENMSAAQAETVEAESEQLTFEQKQLSEIAQQSVVNLVRNFAAKGLLKIQ